MKTRPKGFDDVKGLDEAKGFDLLSRALSRAAVCVAALALCALALGCLSQGTSAPPGDADAKSAANAAPVRADAPAANATAAPGGESPLPRPAGYVSDFAGVIDAPTRERLEAWLGRLRERTKIEVAVVTVETTGERSVNDYSLAVARGWGVGPPAGEEGGGVLLLLAVKDHKWRIQVTRSLESDLPDEAVGQIGGRMTPDLREGRYGEAVLKCVDGLVKRLGERRGFSTKGDELLPEAPPEEKTKPAVKSEAAP